MVEIFPNSVLASSYGLLVNILFLMFLGNLFYILMDITNVLEKCIFDREVSMFSLLCV